MHVLIIEDEKKTAAYLRKGLSESEFVIDVAAEGEDGLHLARTGDSDLIILDVMLPKRDGWSVITELRRSGKQTPVTLAHELRTPINNLIGEAEVALSKDRTPEEYRQILGSSLEEYARLSRMMENLLFLAQAEKAQLSIERSLIEGRKEMEAVREFYEALAEEQGVEVVCQGNAELMADLVLFRQGLSNLVSNALCFTPRKGRILLSIRHGEDQWVEVKVSDTGSGIGPEHLPRLFDRFYRVDPARSRKTSGMGLGLSIVRSIMEIHHGTVAIQSEPGKGTAVTLRFPPLT